MTSVWSLSTHSIEPVGKNHTSATMGHTWIPRPTLSMKSHGPVLLASKVTEQPLPASVQKQFSWRNPEQAQRLRHLKYKQSYIQRPPNQGSCGSCWAVASASVLGDRMRIMTEDLTSPTLSPNGLVACYPSPHDPPIAGDPTCGTIAQQRLNRGCCGGDTLVAANFMAEQGLVSTTDWPYNYEPVPSCPGPNTRHYFAEKGSAHRVYVPGHADLTITAIQQEIYWHGPVVTGFYVFRDFLSFFQDQPQGIYVTQTPSSENIGGHAVVIVGWGHDAKTNLPYWEIRNSWGEGWADDGYFKVARGPVYNQTAGFDNPALVMSTLSNGYEERGGVVSFLPRLDTVNTRSGIFKSSASPVHVWLLGILLVVLVGVFIYRSKGAIV